MVAYTRTSVGDPVRSRQSSLATPRHRCTRQHSVRIHHRFPKHITDMGHVPVDPFRVVLKRDARPVKQKPYRYLPVLAAKVCTEIDKLLLAGILRRSYSNWASPLVVVAKSVGCIRLTCNYKNIIEQSIFQSFGFQWLTTPSQNWGTQE